MRQLVEKFLVTVEINKKDYKENLDLLKILY
jgi:hypothetical protein